MSDTLVEHEGNCHCKAVRFKFAAAADVVVQSCNCSICTMSGFLHLIVPQEQFVLLAGKDDLTEYRFNTKVAKHLFCKTCGVKSYYIPRSNPDGVSINMNCVDRSTFSDIKIEDFDGQNWEDNAALLAHLA